MTETERRPDVRTVMAFLEDRPQWRAYCTQGLGGSLIFTRPALSAFCRWLVLVAWNGWDDDDAEEYAKSFD